jgi:hypothetical protein
MIKTYPNYTEKLFKENILNDVGFKSFISTENHVNKLYQEFDCRKSIDGFLLDDKFNMEAFGIRHQFGIDYRSFTTRYLTKNKSLDTEYKKLNNAILTDGLKPKYLIHCFWSKEIDGKLNSYGIVKTKNLIDYYNSLDKLPKRVNKMDGTVFLYAPFKNVGKFFEPNNNQLKMNIN